MGSSRVRRRGSVLVVLGGVAAVIAGGAVLAQRGRLESDAPSTPAPDPTPPAEQPPTGPLPTRPPAVDRPSWKFPTPFGRGAAVETMSGVAAPLLGGFSLTLIGVVAQAPASFRWPGAALAALTVVVVLFVAAVQLGYRARTFLYSKGDIDAWWPETRVDWLEANLRSQQREHYGQWLTWHRRTRFAYNTAVVCLALALVLVLAPPRSYVAGHQLTAIEAGIRWSAAALAALAGVAELEWVLHDGRKSRATRRRYQHRKGTDDGKR